MQPNSADEGSTFTSPGYELSFPHIRLASEEDDILNKSLLESLSPASPSSSAPYRLPKLSTTGSVSSCASCSSGRSERGGSKDGGTPDSQSPRSVASKNSRKANIHNASAKLPRSLNGLSPPYTIAQLRRAQHIHVPTFKRAQFAPVVTSPIQATEVRPGVADEETGSGVEDQRDNQLDAEKHTRASTRFTHASRSSYGARSAAVSMTIPMATGSVYSHPPDQKPEWRLSPYRHKNYDNQAVSPHFGPYSRGFVIHCSTPKTWLQMKLRRTKTTLI